MMKLKVIRRDFLVGVSAFADALAIFGNKGVAASPKIHLVKIRSFQFEPQNIVASIGDTICWTDEALAPHTATATEASWDTGEIIRNDTRSVEVTERMEISYFCAFHPHMMGTIELI
ncbi:MAG: plastocyanin/azurin family copper-binding protein [Pseudomonadota bacterium]